MRTYEAMFILAPTLDLEAADDFARRMAELVQRAGGEVHGIEPWGKRRLAYDIRHHREGIYYVMRFSAEVEVPRELRRALGLAEPVLRYLVMRLDEREAEAIRARAERAAEAEEEEEEADGPAGRAGAGAPAEASAGEQPSAREVEPLGAAREPEAC
ncbi:MAG: 30S ribosomal protein S6 [Clostridia bacterium]|nr:30S ribosomal protein S6 [Clostridia bacterium]